MVIFIVNTITMNQKEVWDFLNTHHLSDTYCKNVGFHTSSDLLKTKPGTGGIQIHLKFFWLVCNLYKPYFIPFSDIVPFIVVNDLGGRSLIM